jgi:DNA-binding transcriptional regulator PaaX
MRNYSDNNRVDVKEVVLGTVKVVGIISMTLLAPNAIQALELLDGGKLKRNRKSYVDKTIGRLLKQKLIRLATGDNGKKFFELTDKGEALLDRYEMKSVKIKQPRSWDGKYRMVIFDIKEGKRSTRDELRRWLEELGFLKLQNSVWVFPYECREVVVLLKSRLGVGAEVLYLIIENIENDEWLKEAFGLLQS